MGKGRENGKIPIAIVTRGGEEMGAGGQWVHTRRGKSFHGVVHVWWSLVRNKERRGMFPSRATSTRGGLLSGQARKTGP